MSFCFMMDCVCLETTPYLSDGFSADEMYKAMLSRGKLENRPEMAWKPIKDKL